MPIGRNFEYLEKNGVLPILDQLAGPDDNAVHDLGHIFLSFKSHLYTDQTLKVKKESLLHHWTLFRESQISFVYFERPLKY